MGNTVLDAIQKLKLEATVFVPQEGTERYGSDPEWDYALLKSHQQWVRDAIVLSQKVEENPLTLSYQSNSLATRILAKSVYVPLDPVAHSALLKRLLLAESALECHLDSLVRSVAATKEPGSIWCERSSFSLLTEGFSDWVQHVKKYTSESSLLYMKLEAASERVTLPVVDADSAKTICSSMVLGGDIDLSSQFAWSILEQALAAYIPILDARSTAIASLNEDIAKLDSTKQKKEYDDRMTAYLPERARIDQNADPLRGMMGRYSGRQLLAVLGVPAWLAIWFPVVKAQKEAALSREATTEAEMKALEVLDRAQKAEKALNGAASREVSSISLREALYAQALANSNGDERMIRDEYLRLNAEQLSKQAKVVQDIFDEEDRERSAAFEKYNQTYNYF